MELSQVSPDTVLENDPSKTPEQIYAEIQALEPLPEIEATDPNELSDEELNAITQRLGMKISQAVEGEDLNFTIAGFGAVMLHVIEQHPTTKPFIVSRLQNIIAYISSHKF